MCEEYVETQECDLKKKNIYIRFNHRLEKHLT